MHEDLQNRNTASVDVLNLLGSDVLALGQLKDVLLPVHNAQSAILKDQMFTQDFIQKLETIHNSYKENIYLI